MTEFIWGNISDTSSWKWTFLAPHFSSRSVNAFQCSHCHIIKDMLVYFVSWMSENEKVASCLNHVQRISVSRALYPESEKNRQTFQEISLFWQNWKATNKFTFKLIFKGVLWIFWMSLQVLLESLCWKAVNFGAIKLKLFLILSSQHYYTYIYGGGGEQAAHQSVLMVPNSFHTFISLYSKGFCMESKYISVEKWGKKN